MSKQEIMPATQQQNLEARIGNSTKIAKRLMKKTLEDKRAAAMEEYSALRDVIQRKSFELSHKVSAHILEKVQLSMTNDSEMTRLRNLMEKFSSYSFKGVDEDDEHFHPKTNKDMLEGTIHQKDLLDVVSRISEGGATKDSLGKAFLELWDTEQAMTVTAYLVYPDISMLDGNNFCEEYMSFDLDVHIPADMVQEAQAIWVEQKDLTKLNEAINNYDLQLQNIDDTVEEMEARLLVKELQSSEEGMATLAIAGELVGNMLGETPTLLQVNKE